MGAENRSWALLTTSLAAFIAKLHAVHGAEFTRPQSSQQIGAFDG
jgi:hypothetical protein